MLYATPRGVLKSPENKEARENLPSPRGYRTVTVNTPKQNLCSLTMLVITRTWGHPQHHQGIATLR